MALLPKRLSRAIAFGRHIPPVQLVQRALLMLRRRIDRAFPPSLSGPAVSFSFTAPLPLFAARAELARKTGAGWTFTFLNRIEQSPDPIDWRLGGAGGANQLWRMNLHYFEWIETLEDAPFVGAIDQWLSTNPPFAPGADQDGWNSYALSLRVVVWLQQLAKRRDRLDPDWIEKVVGEIARQLRYLETHLERDIGGNHLIKNIVALLWGSAAIEGSDTSRWRTRGLALLRRELAQILPDGMHYERSTSYHAQVLGDLLEIRHALSEDPFEGALEAAIARAAQVLADLAHPDGGPALFGDAGLTMSRSPMDLLAAAGCEHLTARTSFDLRDGGYAGLRSGSDTLIVDAGPLGPDTLPGHAHGDIGSIEWSVAGERMIVDQGVFTYVAGAQRHGSRTATNHNTLAAPEADQGDFFGAFRLGERCHLVRRSVVAEPDRLQVDVEHDGLVGRQGGARHRRRFDATRDEILILDSIDRDLTNAAISFLLAPSVEVREDENGITLIGPTATCRIATDGKVTIERAKWWPDMGHEFETRRIRIALGGQTCRTLLTVIYRKEA